MKKNNTNENLNETIMKINCTIKSSLIMLNIHDETNTDCNLFQFVASTDPCWDRFYFMCFHLASPTIFYTAYNQLYKPHQNL